MHILNIEFIQMQQFGMKKWSEKLRAAFYWKYKSKNFTRTSSRGGISRDVRRRAALSEICGMQIGRETKRTGVGEVSDRFCGDLMKRREIVFRFQADGREPRWRTAGAAHTRIHLQCGGCRRGLAYVKKGLTKHVTEFKGRRSTFFKICVANAVGGDFIDFCCFFFWLPTRADKERRHKTKRIMGGTGKKGGGQ